MLPPSATRPAVKPVDSSWSVPDPDLERAVLPLTGAVSRRAPPAATSRVMSLRSVMAPDQVVVPEVAVARTVAVPPLPERTVIALLMLVTLERSESWALLAPD